MDMYDTAGIKNVFSTYGNSYITGGNFGLGVTSPLVALHVAQLPSGTAQFNLDCASDTSTSPATWALRKARGTIASPTNVSNGDIMGLIRADAYSAGYLATAQIKFFVDGTFTSGQRPPSRIEFFTNPANTSPAVKMTLDNAGDFYFSDSGSGLPYGSFYGNEIAYSTGALTAPQYKQIADTDCDQGELNLVTYTDAGTTLTVSKAGRYLINWSISVETGTANTHILAGIMVNSTTTLQAAGRNHTEPGRANVQYALSGTAILSLAANDVVGVGVGSDVDNITATVDHVNLSIVHIGG
jgi:hypothetical protein